MQCNDQPTQIRFNSLDLEVFVLFLMLIVVLFFFWLSVIDLSIQ